MNDLVPVELAPFLPFILLAVLGLVQFIKGFGLNGRLVMLVSFLVGAAYYGALALLPPATGKLIVGITLFGLGASGLYDLTALFSSGIGKAIAGTKTNSPTD
jgi:hypothetical protein